MVKVPDAIQKSLNTDLDLHLRKQYIMDLIYTLKRREEQLLAITMKTPADLIGYDIKYKLDRDSDEVSVRGPSLRCKPSREGS